MLRTLEQPGVKAPGTPKMITFLPLTRSPVLILLAGESSKRSTEGRESPTWNLGKTHTHRVRKKRGGSNLEALQFLRSLQSIFMQFAPPAYVTHHGRYGRWKSEFSGDLHLLSPWLRQFWIKIAAKWFVGAARSSQLGQVICTTAHAFLLSFFFSHTHRLARTRPSTASGRTAALPYRREKTIWVVLFSQVLIFTTSFFWGGNKNNRLRIDFRHAWRGWGFFLSF